MESLIDKFELLVEQALDIWVSGGWAMIAIALVAMVLFGLGVHIWLKLQAKGFRSVPERVWRRWIQDPTQRRGPIGRMLDFVTGHRSLGDMRTAFDQLRTTEIQPFERELKVMKICVGAAPLLGLLGTVTGMLATFGALSSGSGDQTMDMIAGGISEALVTTQTGLVIALPGLFFQYQLARSHERGKAFMAHLESVCMQDLYRRMKNEDAAAVAA